MKEFLEKISKPHFGLPIGLFILYILFGYSFLSEYFYKYKLCQLQVTQRFCVVICIILITFALLFKNKLAFYKKLMDSSCIILFWGILSMGYKLLLQYKILEEASFLKTEIPFNVSVDEMNEIVRLNEINSCANINLTIFGIPDTAYILVLLIFLFTFLSYCFKIPDQFDESNKSEK